MDSLFDDKPYEVGDEIEAYCPNARCRGDTTHIIRGMYESEIRRVECTVCGDLHGFRKPRGIPYDDEPAPESTLKKRSSKLKKPTWEEAMAKVTEQELANCRPYSTLDNYELLDVVSHPLFEIGFITELLPDNKIEVSFKDKPRILVHRKKDGGEFASKISELPAPRQTRSRRKKRRKEGPSELAQRLMSERMLARTGTKNFEQVAEAKEELAEKAALENRRLALEMVARKLDKGIELTEAEKSAAKDARRLQREEEKRRKAAEREKLRQEKEREREKQRKQKEREREKQRKQKEREKAKREREREREQAKREREKLRQEKERERLRKKKLAEQARRKREQERRQKAQERIRAAKAKAKTASQRRTGGKKTVASQRRTGGKKTVAKQRRTGGKKTVATQRRTGGGKKSVRRR